MRLFASSALSLAAVLAFALALAPLSATAQIVPPPPSWELRQNDPNPFCSDPGGTRIEFGVAQSARIELVVTTSDGSQLIRRLADLVIVNTGTIVVVWDGDDTNGVPVPDGTYPYRMTATDAQSNVLFEDTKTATVACVTGVETDIWGSIKRRYR
jgi:hypothetical protein